MCTHNGNREWRICKMQNGKEFLKEYGLLTLGTIGIVVSDYFFKFPNHFSFGGVTGIAVSWEELPAPTHLL